MSEQTHAAFLRKIAQNANNTVHLRLFEAAQHLEKVEAELKRLRQEIARLQTVLKQYFFFTIARRPVIVPIIIEV